jgi:AraC-like DNA-binding protein
VLQYAERPAPAALAPHVECVWSVWDSVARADRPPERIVPDGCPELIVHLADPFARRQGTRWVRQPRAFLAGTLSRPWMLRAGRRVRTVGLRFRPAGVPAVFGFDMSAAADREVPLGEVMGTAEARRLLRTLVATRTTSARLAAAEEWLLDRAARVPPVAVAAGAAVPLIVDARGQTRVEDLARTLGWSRRRLERAFQSGLGIRPKLYARIVRLNAVLSTLGGDERAGAVDLALAAGFFDQPHLLRDFRALAGRTPGAGAASDGEMARNFTRPERLRVLLEGE